MADSQNQDKVKGNLKYYDQRVNVELGLTNSDIRTKLKGPNGELIEKPIIYPDDKDNICIRVCNIEREVVQIDHPKATPEKPNIYNERKQEYIVKRLKNPVKSINGDEVRYLMPKNQGTYPLPSPKLIEKYEAKKKIKTLVLTEGYLKMFSLVKNDVDVFGLSSITHYRSKETNTLHPDIIKVIKSCSVENVIMLYDADCFDISEKALKEGKDLQKRPSAFYSSAKNIHKLLEDLNVRFYFAYVNGSSIVNSPKGIDDLFFEMLGKEKEITQELIGSTEVGKCISKFEVSSTNDLTRVFSIWSAGSFYKKYQNTIGTREFVYRDKHYYYDEELSELIRIIILNGRKVVFNNKLKFWAYKIDKDGNETNQAFFDYAKSYDFLEANGFFKIEKCDGTFTFVRPVGNILEEVSTQHIRDFIISFLKEYGDDIVLNMLFRGSNRYVGSTSLSNLATKNPRFIENSATSQYLFFKKCYWHITNKGITIKLYDSLNGIIWSDQIIEKEIELLPELELLSCKDVTTPDNYFNSEGEFLRGLFDTDGCVTHQKDKGYFYILIKISTKHKIFADDIKKSLDSLNIHSFICKNKNL